MDDNNLDALNNEMMTLIRRSTLDKKHGGLQRYEQIFAEWSPGECQSFREMLAKLNDKLTE
jgi:hypothetical protein